MTEDLNFLTVKMLTKYIHMSESTIYHWVNKEQIPYIKLGGRILFDREEIDRWVKSHGENNDELPELPAV